MSELHLSPALEECCQTVLRTVVAGRDALLFAAAGDVNERELRQFCRALADHLGGQAAALEQVLLAHGCRPVAPVDERVDRARATLIAALERRDAAADAERTDAEVPRSDDGAANKPQERVQAQSRGAARPRSRRPGVLPRR